MHKYYTINSIWLNIVFFASAHSAYNYAVKHNIRTSSGKIKVDHCSYETAYAVRKDFNKILKEEKLVNDENIQ